MVAVVQCSPHDSYHVLSDVEVQSILPQIARYREKSKEKFHKDFPDIQLPGCVIVLDRAFDPHTPFLEEINKIWEKLGFSEEICEKLGFSKEINPRLALHRLFLNLLKQSKNFFTELFNAFLDTFHRKPLGLLEKGLDRYLSALDELESGNKNKLKELMLSDNDLFEKIRPKIVRHLYSLDLRDKQIVQTEAHQHLIEMLKQIAGYMRQDSSYKETILTEFKAESSDPEELPLFECLLSLWPEEKISQLKEIFELYRISKSCLAFADFHQYENNGKTIQSNQVILDAAEPEIILPTQTRKKIDFCFSPREAPHFRKETRAIEESPDMQPINSEASTRADSQIAEAPTLEEGALYETETEVGVQDSEIDAQSSSNAEDIESVEDTSIMKELSETGTSVTLISLKSRTKIISAGKEKVNPAFAKKTDSIENDPSHLSEIKIRILLENLIVNGIACESEMLNFALTFGNNFTAFCFVFLAECWQIVYIYAVKIWLLYLAALGVKNPFSQEFCRSIFRYIFGSFGGFKYTRIVWLGNLEPPRILRQLSSRRRERPCPLFIISGY